MDRKDWTLLAISAAEGEPLGPVQLQKSLFVLGRERDVDAGEEFHKFSPYDYGPFAATVYRDAEELEEEGLVMITTPGSVRQYSATSVGLASARRLREESPAAAEYLTQVVEWAKGLSFQALVRAIYARYPEQRENSIFIG